VRSLYESLIWLKTHRLQWLCTDPLQIPPLTTFALSLLSPISPQRSQSYLIKDWGIPGGGYSSTKEEPATPQKSKTYLQKLPVEIVRQIASSLSISSIFALRLSCRKLASMILPDAQFWYERLTQYSLIPYVWDLDIAACAAKNTQPQSVGVNDLKERKTAKWDWKQLAQQLSSIDEYIKMEEIKSVAIPMGFRNRCRIWKIIDGALELES
jgi:hypothetical protein